MTDDHTHPTLHVVDLTDEELLGIDGPLADHVAPLPWLGTRSEDETALAAEVGLRSLVTHGRITSDDATLSLPEDLAALLDLRHDARCLAYADHSTAAAQETRILYVHPHAVLTETVNGAGVHRFSVGDLDPAVDALADWCRPLHGDSGSIEGDGLPSELTGLQSVVCLDVVSVGDDEDVTTRSLTLYRLADGTVVEGVEDEDAWDLPRRTDADVHRRVWETVTGR